MDDRLIGVMLYADDIVLMAENPNELEKSIRLFEEWCNIWRLTVNIDKTKVVHFRNKRKRATEHQFKLNDRVIERVEKYKYLGVYLDEYLDMENTANILSEAAGRALGAVISKFQKLRDVGFRTYTSMFNSGVVTVMDYCSEVWGYGRYENCNKLQNRAIRYFLGVHNKVPILAIQGDMGWVTPKYRSYLNMFRYWNYLVSLDANRLTKHIFYWDMKEKSNNWSADMERLFDAVDMTELFEQKRVCDLDLVSRQLYLRMQREWKDSLPSKPKLRTYAKFKDVLETEDYIKCCLPRYQRSLLAQFRAGILPLHIETGRYRGTQVENRLCNMCTNQMVEDEFHFLCHCDFYGDLRETLYDLVRMKCVNFNRKTVQEKFEYLMANEGKHVARYLNDAWNRRKEILYRLVS